MKAYCGPNQLVAQELLLIDEPISPRSPFREALHSFFALAFFVVVFLLAESAPLIALTARLVGSGLKKLYKFGHRAPRATKMAKPFRPVPGPQGLRENISGFRRIWTQPEVGAIFRSRRLMRSSHEHVK